MNQYRNDEYTNRELENQWLAFFFKESVTMQEGQEKKKNPKPTKQKQTNKTPWHLRNEIKRTTAWTNWLHSSGVNAGKGLLSSGETDKKFPFWEYMRWQQNQKQSY